MQIFKDLQRSCKDFHQAYGLSTAPEQRLGPRKYGKNTVDSKKRKKKNKGQAEMPLRKATLNIIIVKCLNY